MKFVVARPPPVSPFCPSAPPFRPSVLAPPRTSDSSVFGDAEYTPLLFFCETIVNFTGKTDSSVFGAEYTLVIRMYSARFECIRRRTECIRRAFECIRRSIFLNSRPIRVYSAGFKCIRRASVFGETGECIRRELSHLLRRGCNNAVQGPSVFGEVSECIQHIPQYPQHPQCLQGQ